MKKIFIGIIMLLFPYWLVAQLSIVSVKEFNIIKKSKTYIAKDTGNNYSFFGDSKDEVKIDKFVLDSLLFNGKENTYIGPVLNNGHKSIYLIKDVNRIYKMRAGQILIDPFSYSGTEVDSITNEIFTNLSKGVSFDFFCRKYSFDGNKKSECDLGWFKSGDMVKEFEDAVLAHKKGEVFRVKTIFGIHVVKVLEDPIEDSRIVSFIEIKLQ